MQTYRVFAGRWDVLETPRCWWIERPVEAFALFVVAAALWGVDAGQAVYVVEDVFHEDCDEVSGHVDVAHECFGERHHRRVAQDIGVHETKLGAHEICEVMRIQHGEDAGEVLQDLRLFGFLFSQHKGRVLAVYRHTLQAPGKKR